MEHNLQVKTHLPGVNKGFTTTQVIGWGASIVVAISGFFWSQLGAVDSKAEEIKINAGALTERIVVVETANVAFRDTVKELKDDTKELKSDVKELLQRIPKK